MLSSISLFCMKRKSNILIQGTPRFAGTTNNSNSSKRNFSENESFPPSYKFNKKQTNPTTLRGLVHQLIFPSTYSNDSGDLSAHEKSPNLGRIQQIFSILKNPGLRESLYRIQQKTISISEATSNRYDYIVVGAGSAGCALAYRLATSHISTTSHEAKIAEKFKVLLIEAGPKDTNPWIHIPVGYFKSLHNPRIGWGYNIEEETSGLNGRGIAWPRAKVLGGCSSINGLLWVRGIPQDYNNWDELSGNHGIWSWNQIKDCFKRLEGHMALKQEMPDHETKKGDGQLFGSDGPITISDTRYKTGLCNAFIRACEKELKLVRRTRERINIMQEEKDSEKTGFCSILRSVGMGVVGYFQLTTNYGFRSSAAVGYLNKANRLGDEISLDVLTGANVDRILFKENDAATFDLPIEQTYGAIGVELSEHPKPRSFLSKVTSGKIEFPRKSSGGDKKFTILVDKKGTSICIG